jgi:hypothetical protein
LTVKLMMLKIQGPSLALAPEGTKINIHFVPNFVFIILYLS